MTKNDLNPRMIGMIKVLGLIITAILASGGVVAAYYGERNRVEKEMTVYTTQSVKDLENKISPKLDLIINNQMKQTEDIGRIKGKLNIQ